LRSAQLNRPHNFPNLRDEPFTTGLWFTLPLLPSTLRWWRRLLYTKKADRKRLAARALAKWTRPSSDDVVGQPGLAHLHLEKERA
jgi:hypothetical protein